MRCKSFGMMGLGRFLPRWRAKGVWGELRQTIENNGCWIDGFASPHWPSVGTTADAASTSARATRVNKGISPRFRLGGLNVHTCEYERGGCEVRRFRLEGTWTVSSILALRVGHSGPFLAR